MATKEDCEKPVVSGARAGRVTKRSTRASKAKRSVWREAPLGREGCRESEEVNAKTPRRHLVGEGAWHEGRGTPGEIEDAVEAEVTAETPGETSGSRWYLDSVRQREVCAIVGVGCSRWAAAKYVGCSPETIRRTALRDTAFGEQLRKAETGLELRFLQQIQQAAREPKYWRAAAWALERKYPERYERRKGEAISEGEMAGLVIELVAVVSHEVSDLEMRKRIVERLRRWRPSRGVKRSDD